MPNRNNNFYLNNGKSLVRGLQQIGGLSSEDIVYTILGIIAIIAVFALFFSFLILNIYYYTTKYKQDYNDSIQSISNRLITQEEKQIQLKENEDNYKSNIKKAQNAIIGLSITIGLIIIGIIISIPIIMYMRFSVAADIAKKASEAAKVAGVAGVVTPATK